MVEYANEIINFIGIAVSVIVPVVLIRFFHVSDAKRVDKDKKLADDLKVSTEKIAIDLQSNEDRIAKDLKLASVDIAKDLQMHLDTKNDNIIQKMETISNNMVNLGDRVDKISMQVENLSDKQEETRKDQLELINDLQRRADLTNGNIGNIRNDIMDIQDMMDNISDRLPQQQQDELLDQTALNTRNRQRRAKRKQIDSDAVSQGRINKEIGRN